MTTLEVSPDVAIIMLHPEETYSYPKTVLSLTASYKYCAANWNVTEGTIIYFVLLKLLCVVSSSKAANNMFAGSECYEQ